ncbi:RNA polymerase factor sigma-32 [Bartonella sp. TP]|uniref:RNA polymerase factor sigma-32 n=1 Tax=Bartonella sp. TP TaxID=3057550 RepID=UPI0025B1843A|nr:RNA polymerase factor sigma-32 [Bartonella sp. TP]WJW79578.1 RNA polymerase factor sigma-32 [Bartonella sp. TP]
MQECISAARSPSGKSSKADSPQSGQQLNRTILKASMSAPYLGKEEELNLVARWRGNDESEALHEITTAHMRLVISIAAKFRRYNLPIGDLVQEGCIGLLEAAARFDPQREVRFSTYATWWIRASIQDYILRNWSIVRGGTSSAQKSLFFNLRRLRAKLTAENKNLSKDELYNKISSKLGVSVQDVETMDFRFSSNDNSLSSPVVQDEDVTIQKIDMLADPMPLQDQLVERSIDGKRRSLWLQKALRVLNARELQIIQTRRLGEDHVTLESLGLTLGISKERVRQIEARAIQKLRTALLAHNEQTAYYF